MDVFQCKYTMQEFMAMRKISGVVFDMDGLMFDTEALIKRTWDIVGPRMGYEELGHNIYNTLGMNAARRKRYFHDMYGEEFPFEEFTNLYREEYYIYIEEKGVPIKEGLFETLHWMKKRGLKLALATGSSEHNATILLKKAGCYDFFDYKIFGNMIEKSKPDPEIFQKACIGLGLPCEEVVALEDSKNGLLSAVNAGLMTIMIPDLLESAGEMETRIEAKLHSLLEIPDFLEKNTKII